MKILLGIIAVIILAWIGFNIQASESRAAEARRDRVRQATEYLDCKAHAKDPSLCLAPTE
jgi:hypothetical protein